MAFLASLGVPPGCAHQVSSRTRQARQGGMVSPAITPARPLRQGRAGSPCVRVAGGWLARTGSLPAGCRSSQRRGPAPGRRPRPARGRRRPGQAVPGRPDRDSSPLAPPTRSTSRSRPSMPAGAAVTTPSSRLPGARAAAAGSMPGARVPAGARPGPGHGRRWGRPWWRPWSCWSPGTASGRPPGWAALASAEGRAGLAERREAAQASVRSWPMGRGCCFAPGPTSAAAGCGHRGWLLGEPGAGVLAEGPGRLPAGPPRPPVRTRGQGGGVAHQLATPHP